MEKRLPNNWVECRIGDLSFQTNGKSFKSKDWRDSGIPIIRIQNLKSINATFNYIQDKVEDKYHVSKGDLLFAWSGTPGTSFGAFLWDRQNAVLNQHIFRIEIITNNLDKRFYYYSLKWVVKDFIETAHGTAGLAHVTKKNFENKEIAIPTLPEQKRIVTKLDTLFAHLDSLKERLAKVPELLQNFRQSVLTQAVTGKLTEEWREGKGIALWETCTLEEVSEKVGDGLHGTPKYDENGEYYFVNGNNLINGLIVIKTSTKRISNEEYQRIKKNLNSSTILISINGTLGRVAFHNGEDIALGKSACYINLKKESFKYYLKIYFESPLFQEFLEEVATGTTIKNVPLKGLRKHKLLLPSEIEQREIVKRVESLFAKADQIQEKYEALKTKIEQLPQAILAKAFRGELVEQLESDGDARDLLREIEELRKDSKR